MAILLLRLRGGVPSGLAAVQGLCLEADAAQIPVCSGADCETSSIEHPRFGGGFADTIWGHLSASLTAEYPLWW